MSLVVYGISCAWWDDIANVSNHEGLPCCSYCHSMLFQMEKDEWEHNVKNHVHPLIHDYSNFIAWLKGKCFKKLDYAIEQYLKENQNG